jgi:hypothetical protein
VLAGLFDLIVGGIGELLAALGFEKLIDRDETKPAPRNFPPPR